MQQYRDSDAMAWSLGLGRGSSSSSAGQSASDSESDSELSSTGCQAQLAGLRVPAPAAWIAPRGTGTLVVPLSARCRVYRPPLWTGAAATSLYTCPTIKIKGSISQVLIFKSRQNG
jgi:hypothetical protein